MTQSELDALVLRHAAFQRKVFVEQNGAWRQQVMVVTKDMLYAVVLVTEGSDGVLHGTDMQRAILEIIREHSIGIPEAILLLSDVRMRAMTQDEERVGVKRGAIASDVNAAEYLCCTGRSRLLNSGCFQEYKHVSGKIVFVDPEPAMGPLVIMSNRMIPDVWSTN